ncbi:hypothetical protein STXM2123_98 [Streptomyces sp. F-3]|nr:hypothetical protein STXM2123_98 [Streptomyces sp. F-3]
MVREERRRGNTHRQPEIRIHQSSPKDMSCETPPVVPGGPGRFPGIRTASDRTPISSV